MTTEADQFIPPKAACGKGRSSRAAGSASCRWLVEAVLQNGLTDRMQVAELEMATLQATRAFENGAAVVIIIRQGGKTQNGADCATEDRPS